MIADVYGAVESIMVNLITSSTVVNPEIKNAEKKCEIVSEMSFTLFLPKLAFKLSLGLPCLRQEVQISHYSFNFFNECDYFFLIYYIAL